MRSLVWQMHSICPSVRLVTPRASLLPMASLLQCTDPSWCPSSSTNLSLDLHTLSLCPNLCTFVTRTTSPRSTQPNLPHPLSCICTHNLLICPVSCFNCIGCGASEPGDTNPPSKRPASSFAMHLFQVLPDPVGLCLRFPAPSLRARDVKGRTRVQ